VLRTQTEQQKMLAILMKPQLTDFVCRYGARLLKPPVAAVKEVDGLSSAVTTQPDLHGRLGVALSQVHSEATPEQFAEALDNAYSIRCGALRLCFGVGYQATSADMNTNSKLKHDAKALKDSGALRLLEVDMPIECLIVQKFDVFAQLLSS
jgi:hypothetical protein